MPLPDKHEGCFLAVAFSPDRNRKTLASSSSDGTIAIWQGGKLEKTLKRHTDWVNAIDFSPDGKVLISAANDGTVCMWDVPTWNCTGELKGHTDWVNAVAFSPNGLALASASSDGTVRMWDGLMGNPPEPTSMAHNGSVNAVAFSPAGQTVATASSDGTIQLWDGATPIRRQMDHGSDVLAITFSPDGKMLASASTGQTVRLWNVSKGTFRELGEKHLGYALAVAFSPNGKLIASGSSDWRVRLWDVDTGKLKETLLGHRDWVRSLLFLPGGEFLKSTSDDADIRTWDVREKDLGKRLSSAPDPRKQLSSPTTGDDIENTHVKPLLVYLRPYFSANTPHRWRFLESVVLEIMDHLEDGIDVNTYMGVYVAVHNYCTGQVSGLAAYNHRAFHLLGEDLYTRLRDLIDRQIQKVVTNSKTHTGEALLAFYVEEWNRYKTAAKHVHHLFRYLNRHWIRRKVDEGKKNIYFVHTLFLVMWRNVLKDNTEILNVVLNLVEKDRRCGNIESNVFSHFAQVIDSAVHVGVDEQDPEGRISLHFYRHHFESEFVKATMQFYEEKSREFLAGRNAAEYLMMAEKCLDEDERRGQTFLHGDTEIMLKRLGHEALITQHADFLRDRFAYMLENDCQEDMARMYSLLSRTPAELAPLTSKFDPRLRKAGLSAVIKAGSDVQKPKRLLKRSFEDGLRYIGSSGPIESLEPLHLAHDHQAEMSAAASLPFINKQWIGLDGKDLIWLPPDYRPVSAAYHENLLVCGLESGQVLFLEFVEQSQEPPPKEDDWGVPL